MKYMTSNDNVLKVMLQNRFAYKKPALEFILGCKIPTSCLDLKQLKVRRAAGSILRLRPLTWK